MPLRPRGVGRPGRSGAYSEADHDGGRVKAYVISDGTLLRIDRVAMAAEEDRIYHAGKQKCREVNVSSCFAREVPLTLADPTGWLIRASPALPGSRHDIGCAFEHGLLPALAETGVQVLADRGHQGAGGEFPSIRVPRCCRRKRPSTGWLRPLSSGQRAVDRAHAAFRAPGERSDADIKNWRILVEIRSSASCATNLVATVRTIIFAG